MPSWVIRLGLCSRADPAGEKTNDTPFVFGLPVRILLTCVDKRSYLRIPTQEFLVGIRYRINLVLLDRFEAGRIAWLARNIHGRHGSERPDRHRA